MESKKSAACRKSRFGFFNKLTAGAATGSARCVCFFRGSFVWRVREAAPMAPLHFVGRDDLGAPNHAVSFPSSGG